MNNRGQVIRWFASNSAVTHRSSHAHAARNQKNCTRHDLWSACFVACNWNCFSYMCICPSTRYCISDFSYADCTDDARLSIAHITKRTRIQWLVILLGHELGSGATVESFTLPGRPFWMFLNCAITYLGKVSFV